MEILKNLFYAVLFVYSFLLNYSVAAGKWEANLQTINISFRAPFVESTCEGLELKNVVDFGSFSIEELQQGTVSAQELNIRLICNNASKDIDTITMVIRPGPYGYLDSQTLLTSNEGIGIKLISSKHKIIISDAEDPKRLKVKIDDKDYIEKLVFTPIYLNRKDIKLGKFESSGIIEVRYL